MFAKQRFQCVHTHFISGDAFSRIFNKNENAISFATPFLQFNEINSFRFQSRRSIKSHSTTNGYEWHLNNVNFMQSTGSIQFYFIEFESERNENKT